jgi:2-hydroxychromene-2-carboxylate isomerase
VSRAAVFYYDLGSPYAWLTAERTGDRAEWVPVLLGGIFRATGRSSWAETGARADGIAEIERRADERGLPALRWPDPWPNDGLLAMRAAVAADGERFALEAGVIGVPSVAADGRVVWGDDRADEGLG